MATSFSYVYYNLKKCKHGTLINSKHCIYVLTKKLDYMEVSKCLILVGQILTYYLKAYKSKHRYMQPHWVLILMSGSCINCSFYINLRQYCTFCGHAELIHLHYLCKVLRCYCFFFLVISLNIKLLHCLWILIKYVF